MVECRAAVAAETEAMAGAAMAEAREEGRMVVAASAVGHQAVACRAEVATETEAVAGAAMVEPREEARMAARVGAEKAAAPMGAMATTEAAVAWADVLGVAAMAVVSQATATSEGPVSGREEMEEVKVVVQSGKRADKERCVPWEGLRS